MTSNNSPDYDGYSGASGHDNHNSISTMQEVHPSGLESNSTRPLTRNLVHKLAGGVSLGSGLGAGFEQPEDHKTEGNNNGSSGPAAAGTSTDQNY